MQSLLPTLPPELRTLIYTHLSTPSSTLISTQHLRTPHTTTTLALIHHGSPSLLALRTLSPSVLEGHEYHAWLLDYDVEVRMSVRFHGHVHTFSVKDWVRKVGVWMGKLVGKEPWVGRARRWDVKIHWSPRVVSLGKVKEGGMGSIVSGMVEGVLLGRGGDDEGVGKSLRKEKGGEVEIGVYIAAAVATYSAVSGVSMGLGRLLDGGVTELGFGVGREERGVYVLGAEDKTSVEKVGWGLVKNVEKEKGEILVVKENGDVEWSEEIRAAKLVVKKVIEREQETREFGSATKENGKEDWVVARLQKECGYGTEIQT